MRKIKIITVENDEDEQFFMKEGFDQTEYFDVLAQLSNGNELLDWFNSYPAQLPEVILSDLNMPGRNGYDILDDVRSNPQWNHIPVIITSTSYTRSIMDKCFNRGAAAYLVKPDTFVEYVPFITNLYNTITDKQLLK